MAISLGSVRTGAKQIAQNAQTTIVSAGVALNLLLTDPDDYNLAIRQALILFGQDRTNTRTVDLTIGADTFRVTLKGSGAAAELTGADAFGLTSALQAVWLNWDDTVQGQVPMDANTYRIVKDPGALVLELLGDTARAGDLLRVQFDRGHSLTEAPDAVAAPTAGPTAALAGAAGNVDNGAHSYQVTFVTADGETAPSPASSPITVVNKAADGQVSLSAIPVSDDYGVTARRIYRTIAGDTGTRKLVGTLTDNAATTFTDNVADANLGAAVDTAGTTTGANSVDDDDEVALQTLAASMVLQMAAAKAAQNTGNSNLPNDIVDRRTQSDIFRSRAKELREVYATLVGRPKDGSGVAPASAFADMDTAASDGRPFLWHDGR